MKHFYTIALSLCVGIASAQLPVFDTSFNSADTGIYKVDIGRSHVLLPNGKFLSILHSIDGIDVPTVIRLNADGSRDTSFTAVPIEGPYYNASVWAGPSGNFAVTARSVENGDEAVIKVFSADGQPDESFTTPSFSYAGNTNATTIRQLEILPDGKIVVIGIFSTVNAVSKGNIVRLDPAGQVDPTFGGTGFGGEARRLLVQPDGKYLVAGAFNTYNGTTRSRVARINTDGTLDTTFGIVNTGNVTTGYTAEVRDMALFSNGKIVVVGSDFKTSGTIVTKGIVKLNTDGTRDTSFANNATLTYYIESVGVQSDGKIIVADGHSVRRYSATGTVETSFTNNNLRWSNTYDTQRIYTTSTGYYVVASYNQPNGITRSGMFKLTNTGALDLTFNPGKGPNLQYYHLNLIDPNTFTDYFHTALPLLDEKVLLYGRFSSYNDQPVRNICRVTADGDLDTGFVLDPSVALYPNYYETQKTLLQQPDGKILLAGGSDSFTVNGETRNLVRLNYDGSLDTSFSYPEVYTRIYRMALLPDGKLLIAGIGAQLGDMYDQKVVRLNSDGSVDTTFNSALFETGAVNGYIEVEPTLDGKVMVADNNGLIRLNANGSLDSSFVNPPGILTEDITMLPDGKMYVIYNLYSEGSMSNVRHLRRLNANGSIDTTFPDYVYTLSYSDTSSYVRVLPNGTILLHAHILLGSEWNSPTSNLRLLSPVGEPLGDFAVQHGAYAIGNVYVQSCNSLIYVGEFTNLDGQDKNHVSRYVFDPTNGVNAPSGEINQDFTAGQTIADLEVVGQNVTWYAEQNDCQGSEDKSAMSIAELSLDTPLVDGEIYFASQTISGTESAYRLPIIAHQGALSNSDVKKADRFAVYPNPVSQTLFITSDNVSVEKVTLYDSTGRVVAKHNLDGSSDAIDISKLSPGMYLLQVSSGNISETKKIIKQ